MHQFWHNAAVLVRNLGKAQNDIFGDINFWEYDRVRLSDYLVRKNGHHLGRLELGGNIEPLKNCELLEIRQQMEAMERGFLYSYGISFFCCSHASTSQKLT